MIARIKDQQFGRKVRMTSVDSAADPADLPINRTKGDDSTQTSFATRRNPPRLSCDQLLKANTTTGAAISAGTEASEF